ncbi:hypothetical protein SMU66_06234 [Streptococcus mutans N34]|nr:hypothetical protein SMU66_06234 [Streptococcus mutans N34]EMC53376.1 hypothetical protein SMU105_07412 [Streptococcus mutans SF12]
MGKNSQKDLHFFMKRVTMTSEENHKSIFLLKLFTNYHF